MQLLSFVGGTLFSFVTFLMVKLEFALSYFIAVSLVRSVNAFCFTNVKKSFLSKRIEQSGIFLKIGQRQYRPACMLTQTEQNFASSSPTFLFVTYRSYSVCLAFCVVSLTISHCVQSSSAPTAEKNSLRSHSTKNSRNFTAISGSTPQQPIHTFFLVSQ
jgi:hypothetical protein